MILNPYRTLLWLCLLFFVCDPVVAQPTKSYADHSVLSQGWWSRWAVNETGIQQITFDQLVAAGVPLPLESSKIRVFGNGGQVLPENTSDSRVDDLAEVACQIVDHGDGFINSANDYLLFYATGPVTWTFNPLILDFKHQVNYYNNSSCYFINVSAVAGKRVVADTVVTAMADRQLFHFQDYVYHEKDELNLLKSGKVWYGEKFSGASAYTFPFSFPNISDTDSVIVKTGLSARSGDTSYFEISAWGQSGSVMITKVDANVNAEYAKSSLSAFAFLPDNDECVLSITYNPIEANSTGWLNDIEVIATRLLRFTGGQSGFRNTQSVLPGVIQYNLTDLNPQCCLWNVTDPWGCKSVPLDVSAPDGSFKRVGGVLEEFVLFDGTSFLTPVFVENIQNQDLHNTGTPDMVIVTHPDFKTQADRLAAFHQTNDGLEVMVVEPQIIYNEFSSGMQDPAAIRDFMRMMYVRAGEDSIEAPRYLLLFGDGSYDMKDRLEPNTNFIPTYQTLNSVLPTSSFVSDDFFGLLGDNEGLNASGAMDIGIGRLPVGTATEARVMVDKILRYSSPVDLLPPSSHPSPNQISNFADWRNSVTFLADDEDGNLHFRQAETLAGIVDSLIESFNYTKIYLDAYMQDDTPLGDRYPGAHDALRDRAAKGSLIINYTGHGGETGLAEERIFEISDVAEWQNYMNLPVFITATCEFSRYDNPAESSAGEHLLLSPVGGVIAMLSTTRVAYAHSNMIMNSNLLLAAFEPGASQRLGDMVRLGKVRSGSGVYMQNFTLLGDPAMKLAVPVEKVILESLNGDSLNPGSDTVYAGSQVTLQGFIADAGNNILSDFNGEVSCIMFDKPATVVTLRNDPASISVPFQDQKSVIYEGRASVEQGRFTFIFTLPEDVSFTEGNARLSFYAKTINRDAQGCYDQLALVNDGNDFPGDNQGPEIKLYMNDRGFVNDGITAASVNFIGDLSDDDGINFFGAGIGHDIIMVLDDDFVNPVVLNEYYGPELNNSGKGSLTYPIGNLTEGPHKVWLRCWDVLNYSSEKEISFIVKENNELSMNHVKVMPNPFTHQTTFCFDRNKTQGKQWARLIIRTVDGKTLYENEEQLQPDAGTSLCMPWDGTTGNGSDAPAGLYIYTLKITDETGDVKQFTGLLSKIE